jgi:hypothetical protein
MSIFTKWWKVQIQNKELFEKSEYLTKSELLEIQRTIYELQKKGLPSSKIILALQKQNKKLAQKWRAERAFWTETKATDTKKIGEAGEELDITKYKVILSPSACEACRSKCDNGHKIFKSSDIEKAGYGHVPPFHPNCFCVMIPTV